MVYECITMLGYYTKSVVKTVKYQFAAERKTKHRGGLLFSFTPVPRRSGDNYVAVPPHWHIQTRRLHLQFRQHHRKSIFSGNLKVLKRVFLHQIEKNCSICSRINNIDEELRKSCQKIELLFAGPTRFGEHYTSYAGPL